MTVMDFAILNFKLAQSVFVHITQCRAWQIAKKSWQKHLKKAKKQNQVLKNMYRAKITIFISTRDTYSTLFQYWAGITDIVPSLSQNLTKRSLVLRNISAKGAFGRHGLSEIRWCIRTIRWPNVVSMLYRRLRRRPNIETALCRRVVFGWDQMAICLWPWHRLAATEADGCMTSQETRRGRRVIKITLTPQSAAVRLLLWQHPTLTHCKAEAHVWWLRWMSVTPESAGG